MIVSLRAVALLLLYFYTLLSDNTCIALSFSGRFARAGSSSAIDESTLMQTIAISCFAHSLYFGQRDT